MAKSTVDVSKRCVEIQTWLERVLDKNEEAKPVYLLIDGLVDNVRRIPENVSVDLARSVFFPFGTRSIDQGSLVLGFKMVRLMNWWLRAKPTSTPAKPVLEILRERRIIASIKQADGKVMAR
ncbi:unnamed protein product [Rotaria magnacalcarata]|nr:unnamed protein product [Rotaria magnacalcarata]CAF1990520.1 unnamed protein product [Rotaria magnacalcarata]CAF3933211.1 unnamed protein product [Rotaria magnacalcarata]CAF4021212.1 unnamed protein product [Rotaria magnacalcarata]